MPNIEIVGFETEKAEDLKYRIFSKLRFLTLDGDRIVEDTVITIHPAEAKDHNGTEKPYIRIASTNGQDFKTIINVLKMLMIKLDVETLKLDSFVEIRHSAH